MLASISARRLAGSTLTALAVVGLLGAVPVSAASGPHTGPVDPCIATPIGLARPVVVARSVSKTVGSQTLVASVTPGHDCGAIIVVARVLHGAQGAAFSATATAHFASGDVTVTLRRSGAAFVAVGKIRVPATQPAGSLHVHVLITYAGTATLLAATARVTLYGGSRLPAVDGTANTSLGLRPAA
jgi:hypothetical protein